MNILQNDIAIFLANGGVIHEIPTPEYVSKKSPRKQNLKLTSIEAARLLGINSDSLSRSRATGLLLGWPTPEFTKVGKRKIIYRQKDIETWKTIHGIG